MTTSTQNLEAPSLQNRLVGRLPRIGIRPVIDGRRKGIRESLAIRQSPGSPATRISLIVWPGRRTASGLPPSPGTVPC